MISRFWFVLPNFITQCGVHHILIVALHLFIHISLICYTELKNEQTLEEKTENMILSFGCG